MQAARRAASSSTAKPNLTGHRNRQVIRRRDDRFSTGRPRASYSWATAARDFTRRAFRQNRAARCDPESACGAGACPLDCTPDPFWARRHFDVANAELGERIDDRIERCLVVDGPGDSGRVFNLDEAVGGFPSTPIADESLGAAMLYSSGTTEPRGKPGSRHSKAAPGERQTLRWRERTIGSVGEGPEASYAGSLSLRLFGWREATRGDIASRSRIPLRKGVHPTSFNPRSSPTHRKSGAASLHPHIIPRAVVLDPAVICTRPNGCFCRPASARSTTVSRAFVRARPTPMPTRRPCTGCRCSRGACRRGLKASPAQKG